MSEFLELCPNASRDIVEGIFGLFDMDVRDDKISFSEFCAFILLASDTGRPEDKLEAIFPIVDTDGDNLINRNELTQALRMLYYARFRDLEYSNFKVPQVVEEVVSSAGTEDMTLRQFTQWARSDKPLVSLLRESLEKPVVLGDEDTSSTPETWVIQAHMCFDRIKVDNPIVELDGDEMARVLWQMIKEKLIFPFLDMEIDYYDLSITYRDETDDQVTIDAARAIQKHNVGIKCSTITPDESRVLEFNLKRIWPGPNNTIRHILDGTMFHAPIICPNIPRFVHGWEKPVIVGRHAHGDQYRASQLQTSGPGTFKITFVPDDGEPVEVEAYHFDASSRGGVMLGMYNTRKSIKNFAKSCFEHALAQELPLYLSTQSTILKDYDGVFRDIFRQTYEKQYKDAFEAKGLWFQHRALDDMVRQVVKSSGGFVWACKNYDGDLMSNMVCQGYGSPGLMLSSLVCPDGKTVLTEASHGTITSHYKALQQGEPTSTNPMALIFAWSRGLAQRAKLDGNERLAEFSRALEEACRNCVERGQMSKDLATCVHGAAGSSEHWLLTEDLLDAFARELKVVLLKPPRPNDSAQEEPFEEPVVSQEA